MLFSPQKSRRANFLSCNRRKDRSWTWEQNFYGCFVWVGVGSLIFVFDISFVAFSLSFLLAMFLAFRQDHRPSYFPSCALFTCLLAFGTQKLCSCCTAASATTLCHEEHHSPSPPPISLSPLVSPLSLSISLSPLLLSSQLQPLRISHLSLHFPHPHWRSWTGNLVSGWRREGEMEGACAGFPMHGWWWWCLVSPSEGVLCQGGMAHFPTLPTLPPSCCFAVHACTWHAAGAIQEEEGRRTEMGRLEGGGKKAGLVRCCMAEKAAGLAWEEGVRKRKEEA